MAGEPLYLRLVNEWATSIRNGVIKPGEKLPSVRQACANHQVSPATVLLAYRTMEDQGLIEARPQSGFYVKAVSSLPLPNMLPKSSASANLEVADTIETVLNSQDLPGYIDLSLASPRNSQAYPSTRLKQTLSQLARQHPELTINYTFPPGSERLRRQIAQRMLAWGCLLNTDDILITNGCAEALQLALRAVTQPGHTVGLESPTYFALLPLIKSLGLSAIEIPTHPQTGLSLDALELLLSEQRLQAIIAMPTVHNPLGCSMSLPAKARLAALVNEYRVPLIEDAAHAELFYGQATPHAVKAYDENDWIILCGSYSKSLAPGFRIGWVAGGRFQKQLSRLKFASSISQPRLLEETIAAYLETGSYDHHLRVLRKHYQGQMARLRSAVANHFPPGTRASQPSGGCLLWVELARSVDTLKLYQAALTEHITVVPGAMYSTRGRYRHCLRLSCCYPWDDAYEAALLRVAELATQID